MRLTTGAPPGAHRGRRRRAGGVAGRRARGRPVHGLADGALAPAHRDRPPARDGRGGCVAASAARSDVRRQWSPRSSAGWSLGGALGLVGVAFPGVELAIVLSVVGLGLAVALAPRADARGCSRWSPRPGSRTATRTGPRPRVRRTRCSTCSGSSRSRPRCTQPGCSAARSSGGARSRVSPGCGCRCGRCAAPRLTASGSSGAPSAATPPPTELEAERLVDRRARVVVGRVVEERSLAAFEDALRDERVSPAARPGRGSRDGCRPR